MTRLERDDLKELRNLALSNINIHGTIQEKNDTIDKLNHNQKSSYFEPTPSLTPNDDLNLPKEKQLSDDFKKSQKENIENTRKSYDEKIEKQARENVREHGLEHNIEKMDQLSQEEVVLLTQDNGVNKVLEHQKEQELEKSQKGQSREDLPTYLDDKSHEDIFQDKGLGQDKNKPQVDLEKMESHVKDFNQTKQDIDKGFSEKQIQFDENKKSTLDNIRLDEKNMDAIMSDQSMDYVLEDGEKTKEKDSSKDTVEPPSPADDYE